MTDIQKLIAFLAEFDPGFPHEIRGASPEKIAALEVAAGQPLRTVYRQFLLAMGESMGGFSPWRARFGIDELLQYYRSATWRPPLGYFKFGLAIDDPFFDLYLEALDVPQPRIVVMPGGPTPDFGARLRSFRTPVAGTLPELLGTSAYRTMRLKQLPYTLRVAGDDRKNGILTHVQPMLEPAGFQRLWFSNDWVQVFNAPDAAAIATQFPGGVLAIDLGAADQPRLAALAGGLQRGLGLVHEFAV